MATHRRARSARAADIAESIRIAIAESGDPVREWAVDTGLPMSTVQAYADGTVQRVHPRVVRAFDQACGGLLLKVYDPADRDWAYSTR